MGTLLDKALKSIALNLRANEFHSNTDINWVMPDMDYYYELARDEAADMNAAQLLDLIDEAD